jgi:DnaJ-class molecular chaperone
MLPPEELRVVGMLEGHAFTFKEHAEQMPGVTSGDVILHVYSEEHEDFEREGSDLVTHQNISLVEALLGFKLEIKHLDGRIIEIERDKVTEPGQNHEVPGLGMPVFQKPGEFGKLVCTSLYTVFPELP